jgi:DNA adenine methylase
MENIKSIISKEIDLNDLNKSLQILTDLHKKNSTTIKNNNFIFNKLEEEIFRDQYNYQYLKKTPIIKWSGGKSDEIEQFIQYIPKDSKLYIEPFVGGGSLLFHLAPKKSVIADVHTELISFYNAIKNGDGLEIYDFMDDNKNDEPTYYKIRAMKPKNDLQVACKFYYLRKTCFRGMSRYNSSGEFNIPFGKYASINYENLLDPDYQSILENTEIYKTDYKEIFKKYNSADNFVFLDPPYDSKFTDYGYCKFERKNQEELANIFKTTQNKCLMIIGDTELIRELYKDYIVGSYQKNYKFKIHSNRVGSEINTRHLIIKNY